MSIYAISDLHLSFAKDKPMDIFGDNWKNHPQKIKENWSKTIKENDVVLVPGDISWAKNMQEFEPDINFIHNLTGKKIFLSGNHDYWWGSTSALNDLYSDMTFMKNNFIPFKDRGFALCGTRGWLCPNDTYYTDHDEKIYKREVGRLKLSLDLAQKSGFDRFIVMLHYPPTNDKKENSLFIDTLREFNVETVIYGHLHGENSFYSSFQGDVDGINFILVSADFLDFIPIKIFD